MKVALVYFAFSKLTEAHVKVEGTPFWARVPVVTIRPEQLAEGESSYMIAMDFAGAGMLPGENLLNCIPADEATRVEERGRWEVHKKQIRAIARVEASAAGKKKQGRPPNAKVLEKLALDNLLKSRKKRVKAKRKARGRRVTEFTSK